MRSIRVLNLFVAALLVLTGLAALPQQAVAQEPTKAVQPTSGTPGTTFSFFARGLSGNAEYAFWATAPDGKIIGSDDYRTRTFGDRADWTWTSPGDAQPGNWLMVIQRTAKEGDSDREKEKKEQDRETIEFVILGPGGTPPPSGPPANPSQPAAGEQAVAPNPGAPGTEFAFFATGFNGGERVGYWVNAPDGSVIGSDGWEVEANPDGRADWRWESKTDVKPGFYSAVARGKSSGVERVISFEVR